MVRRQDEISESDEHNARGIELADRGWFDEAENEFKKAIALDPHATHAHNNLGTIYVEKGMLLEALYKFLDALKTQDDIPTTHHYLANFLNAHAEQLAMKEYRRAIELEFHAPDVHLNLGLMLAATEHIDEALAELEIAHTQDPDNAIIMHELASCLIDEERYPEAIGYLKKMIKLNPEHVEAYIDLGIAYTEQGFYKEAESALCKAIDIDNEDFAAHYHLAALYTTWDRISEALDQLEIAAKHDQEKTRIWLYEDPVFEKLQQEDRFIKITS